MNCPLRINQTFSIWRGARFVDMMKTIGQQKWAFKWFHTLLFLLKNRLSYRSFISTWRKSTTSTWNVLLSDSIQLLLYTNWRIPILYTFWRILLSDKFYSSRHHPAYRPVLYICLTHYPHCSCIGVWRYSQKYLKLKDVWRFDNNAPFFSTSCIKAIKKCRSSQAKYRQIT